MEPLASLNGIPPYSVLSSGSDGAARDDPRARGKGRPIQLLLDRIDESEAPLYSKPTHPQGADDDFKSVIVSEDSLEESSVPLETTASEVAAETTALRHGVRFVPHPEVPGLMQALIVDPVTSEVLQSIPSEARVDLALRYQEQVVNPLGAELDTLG